MENNLLPGTLILFAVFIVNWLAVFYKWQKAERIVKPLATGLIVVWTINAASWRLNCHLILLFWAQFFGLIGDVLLLHKARYFLLGLVSFLIGHLFYIAIFIGVILNDLKIINLNKNWIWWGSFIIVVWIGMLLLFNKIILPKNAKLIMRFKLWGAAQLYGWVLSLVFFFAGLAILSKPVFFPNYIFTSVGAFLFFISDSIIAYDRFNQRIPKIRNLVMPTYHFAQLSLAWGLLNLLDFV